ncbi:MAG: Gfo/Idh/MocA family oxidoreductase, partial [Victivallales bacterium]
MKNKIKAAVVGLGGMGREHVRAAKDSPWVKGVTGYDSNHRIAEKVAGETGISITSSLEKICEDRNIRIVYIATPNHTHADIAIKLMKAGKAVLCEKPIANTLDEAKKVVAVQKDTKAFLQIGFELRYSKLYMKVKEWIDKGLVGEIVSTH